MIGDPHLLVLRVLRHRRTGGFHRLRGMGAYKSPKRLLVVSKQLEIIASGAYKRHQAYIISMACDASFLFAGYSLLLPNQAPSGILPLFYMANSPFSAEFLAQIKTKLEEEKTRLEAELAKFTTKNAHVADDFDATFPEYGDKADENAQEITDFLANKPLEMTLEKTLRDVYKSLKRMEEGTYGICKYCDQPIDEKRLLARPTSSSCVSCKKTLTQEV